MFHGLLLGQMVARFAHFLDMVWFFRSKGRVSPVLRNVYGIRGQNCVRRLKESVL